MPRRALVALLMLVGCTSAAPSSTSTGPVTPAADGSFPVSVRGDNGPVEIAARPEAIVSLSPTATEMLFAVGAGEQVIAVDDQSNYPPEAPTTDLSGFEPNIEAIASYEPDLVVTSDESGEIEASLEQLEITVLVQGAAATLDDTYAQIEALGVATGHAEEAEALNAGMRSEVRDLVDSVPHFKAAPTYYHELDPTYFTATSSTFIGEVYALAGIENIADPADDGSGYPQLSAEFIVDADPNLIFLADTKCCGESAETVADRPGWNGLSAVRNDAVVELDDDIASRWGPRIVDFLETVVAAVRALV